MNINDIKIFLINAAIYIHNMYLTTIKYLNKFGMYIFIKLFTYANNWYRDNKMPLAVYLCEENITMLYLAFRLCEDNQTCKKFIEFLKKFDIEITSGAESYVVFLCHNNFYTRIPSNSCLVHCSNSDNIKCDLRSDPLYWNRHKMLVIDLINEKEVLTNDDLSFGEIILETIPVTML